MLLSWFQAAGWKRGSCLAHKLIGSWEPGWGAEHSSSLSKECREQLRALASTSLLSFPLFVYGWFLFPLSLQLEFQSAVPGSCLAVHQCGLTSASCLGEGVGSAVRAAWQLA